MDTTRRGILVGLASGAATAVAGCLTGGGVPDVTVWNRTPDPVEVAVTIERAGTGETLLAETLSLPADAPDDHDADAEFENVGGTDAVRVGVDVVDGPAGNARFQDDSSDAAGLHVNVRPGTVAFSHVVA